MGIEIKIDAGLTQEDSSIKATGFLQEPLNDADKDNLFGKSLIVFDENLMRYLAKKGIYGNPILLDYNQAYKKCTPTKAEIVTITSKPIIVKTQEFSNNSATPATFNVQISDSVQDSSSNSWEEGGSITFTQKISYGIGFLTGGSGETSLSYTQSWKESSTHSISYTIGSTSGVTVVLDPNKSVKASLTASRGELVTKVTYNTEYAGILKIYAPLIGWKDFNLEEIAKDFNKQIKLETFENINVGYYSNSKIVLDDGDGVTQILKL